MSSAEVLFGEKRISEGVLISEMTKLLLLLALCFQAGCIRTHSPYHHRQLQEDDLKAAGFDLRPLNLTDPANRQVSAALLEVSALLCSMYIKYFLENYVGVAGISDNQHCNPCKSLHQEIFILGS